MAADHPLRSRFVLDTSLFLSEAIREPEEDLEAAVLRLLDLVAAARVELGVSCHMPPSIQDELTTMLADRDVDEPAFSRLDTWVIRKSPDRRGVDIPASVVYGFIDELSDRVDRGLRVSEDALREARLLAAEEADGDAAADADRLASELRRKYREALRRGVLDSREDFDLLVLARELDAGVVTEDRGILSWADEFGLRQVRGARFPTLLEGYLETGAAADRDRREPE